MKIVVESSFFIKNGRIFEILGRAFAFDAECSLPSFSKWLQTSNYKRKQQHVDLLFRRAHLLIEEHLKKNNVEWQQWLIYRQGSNNYYDIVTRRKQYYKVVKVK